VAAVKFVTSKSISTNAPVKMDLSWEKMEKPVTKVIYILLYTYIEINCSGKPVF